MSAAASPSQLSDALAEIRQVRRWYHSIEVARGLVTPGWFDLRPIVAQMPWPDVRGKRCLDVGTSDGFLAFELERRGAAEVLAVDISAHEDWDFETQLLETGPAYLHHVEGPDSWSGFAVARRLLGSEVTHRALSVYDLAPEAVGEFDLVVCGSLLLHLRDPLRALTAIRSVCRGQALVTNQVDLSRSLRQPRQPLLRLDGTSGITQWWLPNIAGNRQLLRAAGFAIEQESSLYCIPYGPAHPPRSRTEPRSVVRTLSRRWLAGNDGVPHHAMLATPRADADR